MLAEEVMVIISLNFCNNNNSNNKQKVFLALLIYFKVKKKQQVIKEIKNDLYLIFYLKKYIICTIYYNSII